MLKKLITIIFVIVLFKSFSFALTCQEILKEIRYQVADTTDTTNSPRYSDDVLISRANIEQTRIARDTKCLYAQYTAATSSTTQEYRKPEYCLTIDRVSVAQSTTTVYYKKLDRLAMTGLDRDKPTWENYSASLPLNYYERGDYIGIVPKPSLTYACDTGLKIDYYKIPAPMASLSDEPFDSVYYLRPFHELIVIGVVLRCKKDEGDWQAVSSLLTEYNFLLNLMIEELRLSPDGRIQQLRIGN